MKITDIHTPWRDNWRQASYRGVPFLVEISSKGSGRRTSLHQFPKRDLPYAEDLGRAAKTFTVTGYVIDLMAVAFGYSDYTQNRDALELALEDSQNQGPGALVLPTRGSNYMVTCIRYQAIERRTDGGYCQFDIVFTEAGTALNPATSQTSPVVATQQQAAQTQSVVQQDFSSLTQSTTGTTPATGPTVQSVINSTLGQ